MSRKSAFVFAALVILVVGAPSRSATAQTSPDVPGVKLPAGGGNAQPAPAPVTAPARYRLANTFHFETLGVEWLAMRMSGRSWLDQVNAVRRRALW